MQCEQLLQFPFPPDKREGRAVTKPAPFSSLSLPSPPLFSTRRVNSCVTLFPTPHSRRRRRRRQPRRPVEATGTLRCGANGSAIGQTTLKLGLKESGRPKQRHFPRQSYTDPCAALLHASRPTAPPTLLCFYTSSFSVYAALLLDPGLLISFAVQPPPSAQQRRQLITRVHSFPSPLLLFYLSQNWSQSALASPYRRLIRSCLQRRSKLCLNP